MGNITDWTYAHAQRQPTLSNPLALTAGASFAYGFTYDGFNRLKTGTLTKALQPAFTLDNLNYESDATPE